MWEVGLKFLDTKKTRFQGECLVNLLRIVCAQTFVDLSYFFSYILNAIQKGCTKILLTKNLDGRRQEEKLKLIE